MARIDDYKEAVRLGKEALLAANPKRIADLSGCRFTPKSDGDATLGLKFFNRDIDISWSDLAFVFKDTQERLSIQQQVILLHYLKGANGSSPKGDWIAYQEVPDGKFYLDAFVRRAKDPMVQAFGDRPELLEKLAAEQHMVDIDGRAREFQDAFLQLRVKLVEQNLDQLLAKVQTQQATPEELGRIKELTEQQQEYKAQLARH